MTPFVVAAKDLRLLVRSPATLAFTALVPVAVVTIVAFSLSGPGSQSVLLPVVDEDQGPVAAVLIDLLDDRLSVDVVPRERAEALVGGESRAAAALVLPERLSKRYLGGRPSTLTLLTDPAKGNELDVVRATLLWVEREATALADPLSEELLLLEEQNLTGSSLSTTSVEQNVPGFSVMFALMAVLFGSAFGIQDERDQGSALRLRIAPVSHAGIVGGKLLAQGIVGFVQLGVLLLVGRVLFALPLGPSPLALVASVAAIVFCFCGFSLLVTTFVRRREQIIPLGLTVVMLVCSVGGCWWPIFYMPPWMQQLAHAAPTAWAMDVLSDLILRERGLPEVLPLIGALVAYGGACLAVGLRLLKL